MLVTLKDSTNKLRESSTPIADINDRHKKIAEEMTRIMHETYAVGMAAPQVGEALRLVVLRLGLRDVVIVNPVITEKKGFRQSIEGCLSVPDFYYEVERPESCVISGTNLNGEKVEYNCFNIEAAIACHEVDHLDGILIDEIGIKSFEKREIKKDNLAYGCKNGK